MRPNRKLMLFLVASVIVGAAGWNGREGKSVAANAQNSSNPSAYTGTIWEPPPDQSWQNLPSATVRNEMVSRIRVSGTPIILEDTSITEIAKRFGATVGRRGDAGTALQWICIAGKNSSGKWVLWLESGEIDGGTIGGFRWQRVSDDSVFGRSCRALKAASVELPGRLRLGLTKTKVKTILGKPSGWQGEMAIYFHEHTEPIHGETYTSDNIVEILFREGKVQAIDVSKTTSD